LIAVANYSAKGRAMACFIRVGIDTAIANVPIRVASFFNWQPSFTVGTNERFASSFVVVFFFHGSTVLKFLF
jgi:hypothetical protein